MPAELATPRPYRKRNRTLQARALVANLVRFGFVFGVDAFMHDLHEIIQLLNKRVKLLGVLFSLDEYAQLVHSLPFFEGHFVASIQNAQNGSFIPSVGHPTNTTFPVYKPTSNPEYKDGNALPSLGR